MSDLSGRVSSPLPWDQGGWRCPEHRTNEHWRDDADCAAASGRTPSTSTGQEASMTITVHPNTDCSNCGHTSDCGLHDSENQQPCDCPEAAALARYNEAVGSGLSDAEARDLGWPYA